MKRLVCCGRSWRWLRHGLAVAVCCWALVPLVPMPIVDCPCDHAELSSLSSQVCSLCETAEKRTSDVYFLKDINPHKPNRYLALPRAHDKGFQSSADLSEPLHARLWTRAAERAQELYPDRWGLAQNGHYFRTQCHAHIHIGPLRPEIDDKGGEVVGRAEGIPNVGPEQGIWIHPKDSGYCVHLDRDLAEIVLVR